MTSPDTIILLIVDYHAAIWGPRPHASPPCVRRWQDAFLRVSFPPSARYQWQFSSCPRAQSTDVPQQISVAVGRRSLTASGSLESLRIIGHRQLEAAAIFVAYDEPRRFNGIAVHLVPVGKISIVVICSLNDSGVVLFVDGATSVMKTGCRWVKGSDFSKRWSRYRSK